MVKNIYTFFFSLSDSISKIRVTSCKVTNAPVTSLQFLIKRDLGTAQFSVDKVSNENNETGQKLILGAFALVYVVEGNVRIGLDENTSPQGYNGTLSPGQTLYVERDEDASPTSMLIQASDPNGAIGHRDHLGNKKKYICKR